MGFRGRDGGDYNSLSEMIAADNKFEQQETQNSLLEEQNDLIRKQAILEAKLQMEKMNHEKEMKIMDNETQKEILQLQIEHEKEMRILKLFDDAGLSKDSYDQFMNRLLLLLPSTDGREEINMTADGMKQNLKDINKYYEDPQNNFKYVEDIIPDCLNKKLEYLNLKNDMTEYLVDGSNKFKLIEYFKKQGNATFKKEHKKNSRIGKWLFIIAIAFALIGLALDINFEMAMLIYFGLVIIATIFIIKGAAYKPSKKFIEQEIEQLDDRISHMDKYHNYDEQIKERKEQVEKFLTSQKLLEKNFNSNVEIIKGFWDVFVEFRKQHYNNKIEKILIETGIKDKLESVGITYQKINNSNKKGDGTIEDYEMFFDSFIEGVNEEINGNSSSI